MATGTILMKLKRERQVCNIMENVMDIFIHDTKRDLNELFSRVREAEKTLAVGAERDKTLLEKMDDLSGFFKRHDALEMEKYNHIEAEVVKLTKLFYIASGIGLVLGFIGIDNLKLLLAGG